MDLRVSVALLFIFLTGGYSLKCYTCEPDGMGFCAEKVETCPVGHNTCLTHIAAQLTGTVTLKACTDECVAGTFPLPEGGTVTNQCCTTDLCNAADGVYKGSFLLLLSPLLFYFLIQ